MIMKIYSFLASDNDGQVKPVLHVVAKGFASAVAIAMANDVTEFVSVNVGPEVLVENTTEL